MADIAVIDYGMGNLRSVEQALRHVAGDRTVLVTWTGTPKDPSDLWAWEAPEAAFTIVARCP